jgi:peptidoglycan L-alanyl-D-glutamate endopeptidase CwlK
MIDSRDISQLHPTLQRAAQGLIQRMAVKGYPVLITSTYRDNEMQNYLYSQGRTRSGSIVTNAKGGQSIHNYRLAFDICKNIKGQEYNDAKFFSTVGAIGREMGLTWGGDWASFPDRPHFEFTNGLTLAQLQKGNKVPENTVMKWEKAAANANTIIYKMEQQIPFDKVYWQNALNGAAVNPTFLKILINRLLGKGETGTAISTENVLANIKTFATSPEYWRKVFDGAEAVNTEWLKALLARLC